MPQSVPRAPSPVRHHAQDVLTRLDAEPEGYGMYTYVILGAASGAGETLPADVAERYGALLQAIALIDPVAVLDAAHVPKQAINLFMVPVLSATPALPGCGHSPQTTRACQLDLRNYHFELAATYRIIARGSVAGDPRLDARLERGLGPFLISTLKPINQLKGPGPMLVADLSRHNHAAMREVVAAYRKRLNTGLAEEAQVFEPLRLQLLTLVLDADDNIKLMKEAVAGWLPVR